MDNIILKIEQVSKQYRLGLVGTGTLGDDLKRWWFTIRGKEDPFTKIGETNDRSSKGTSDVVWSLNDININKSCIYVVFNNMIIIIYCSILNLFKKILSRKPLP